MFCTAVNSVTEPVKPYDEGLGDLEGQLAESEVFLEGRGTYVEMHKWAIFCVSFFCHEA